MSERPHKPMRVAVLPEDWRAVADSLETDLVNLAGIARGLLTGLHNACVGCESRGHDDRCQECILGTVDRRPLEGAVSAIEAEAKG